VLRLGVFWRECCCAQSIVQCYFTKPEFFRECAGVSHQMAVLPRVAHKERHVPRLQFFRRQIILKRLGGLEFKVEDIAPCYEFIHGLRLTLCAGEQERRGDKKCVKGKSRMHDLLMAGI
jgi:hypothetical protein